MPAGDAACRGVYRDERAEELLAHESRILRNFGEDARTDSGSGAVSTGYDFRSRLRGLPGPLLDALGGFDRDERSDLAGLLSRMPDLELLDGDDEAIAEIRGDAFVNVDPLHGNTTLTAIPVAAQIGVGLDDDGRGPSLCSVRFAGRGPPRRALR